MPESDIADVLLRSGPLTGAELQELTRLEIRALWRACQEASNVRSATVGRRYLRLDRSIEGYARLSPSIRREFQTYSVLGHDSQATLVAEKATQLANEIREISLAKAELARESMAAALETVAVRDRILEQVCFILAGDITYGMAHSVPRPESSTGELVRGSDLDIVVIASPDLSAEDERLLDRAILKQKHVLLVHPRYREEIDYLVKDLDRVREQLRFETFEHMVACKILHEGVLLYGSGELFATVKSLLAESGVASRLEALEQKAIANREAAERILLNPPASFSDRDVLTLFYTREESEEIF